MKARIYLSVAIPAAVLFATILSLQSLASEKVIAVPLALQWSNFAGETYNYDVSTIEENSVRVEVRSKEEGYFVVTNRVEGGMTGLLKLAVHAANEVSRYESNLPAGKERCRLVLKIMDVGSYQQVSIAGDLRPLLKFCNDQPSLHDLLGFISQDLPKKYRLVETGGELLPPAIK
ncbi:hypothetical protein [Pedosphaera parvula]|uniref:Uncharacterized protein n=1 Tax=Pedosphaera parvula (strain Ellin514) TaxID=320771 RepID=B9XN93_PEDPL|nr:hypothetical protein [Pedosphaera parvula]EEF58755.1 hypothetical protein Cflav_PD1851 [Pedosphaera parvula Ellin514]